MDIFGFWEDVCWICSVLVFVVLMLVFRGFVRMGVVVIGGCGRVVDIVWGEVIMVGW